MAGIDRPPPEVSEYFRKIGKKYGSQGGKASAANMSEQDLKERAKKASDAAHAAMSDDQRVERAKKAAAARWAKAAAKKTEQEK